MSDVILQAIGLKKHFPIRQGILQRVTGYVRAVDGVNLSVERGSVLGIVGESACGKSTLARLLIGLIPVTEGEVKFDGESLTTSTDAEKRTMRRRMNIVFQDPYSSLNPRLTVASLISEPLIAHHLVQTKREGDCRAAYLLEKCGMSVDQLYRYPHQFSGGQRQRICIARALAAEPDLIVCDEAVSALDVSIQSQIINLLMDIRDSNNLTYLFISHNLSVVRFISDQIAVMYLGKIVEYSTKDELFNGPLHPYTQALLSADPTFDKTARGNRIVLEGDIPSPSNPPGGCRFHTRCRYTVARCREEVPEMREISSGHFVACHRCISG